MRIEQQVCTFQQAERLSALGLLNAGIFFYVEFSGAGAEKDSDNFALCRIASPYEQKQGLSWIIVGDVSNDLQHYLNHYGCDNTADGAIFPAFTAAELGLMLPHFPVQHDWAQVETFWSYSSPQACCQIQHSSKVELLPAVRFKADTEAQARAEMLIYLLEQKKVSVEEINKRLIHENN